MQEPGLGGPRSGLFSGARKGSGLLQSWVLVDGDALIYSRLLCAGEGTERNSHKSVAFQSFQGFEPTALLPFIRLAAHCAAV